MGVLSAQLTEFKRLLLLMAVKIEVAVLKIYLIAAV